jgi:hypothetical protein
MAKADVANGMHCCKSRHAAKDLPFAETGSCGSLADYTMTQVGKREHEKKKIKK